MPSVVWQRSGVPGDARFVVRTAVGRRYVVAVGVNQQKRSAYDGGVGTNNGDLVRDAHAHTASR